MPLLVMFPTTLTVSMANVIILILLSVWLCPFVPIHTSNKSVESVDSFSDLKTSHRCVAAVCGQLSSEVVGLTGTVV